jgi:putative nucleotidyltransferase with HDIG domain
MVGFANRHVGWQTSLLILPPIYWVFRSYQLYLGKLEAEKKQVEIEKQHVEDVASLHVRTIEALALAIEAKDQTTHKHLQRVRVFAVAVAQQLGLSEDEIEALRAAALLHDIGKLAVPEHILSKPGPLTPEEFQKVRIHPQVGAEVIAGVPFPYPVARSCARIMRSGMEPAILTDLSTRRSPSALASSRQSIVWMLSHLTGNTEMPCRLNTQWKASCDVRHVV